MGGMMGAQSLATVFFRQFETGNMVVDYMINFAILGIFGFITTQLMPKLKQKFDDGEMEIPCFRKTQVRPQLRFIGKKATNSWQTGIIASLEYRAWLAKVRELLHEQFHTRDTDKGLYQLQEFTSCRSIHDDEGDKKNKSHDPKTEWMPDQEEDFQLTDKIWCHFETKMVEESRADKTENVKNFILTVYTKHKSDLQHLLKYHESLMGDYHERARQTLSTKPHIFELQGLNEENGSIEWDQHEFSSTRQMKHVWFKQKETFVRAYENFLNNQEEYKKRGDPYTFNCLLYGTPGCGKTSILKALVNDSIERGLMTHVFVVSFAKIKDGPMLSRVLFNREVNGHYIPFHQRLVIFEDFDADDGAKVFQKRFKKKTTSAHSEGIPLAPTLAREHSEPNERARTTSASEIDPLAASMAAFEDKTKGPVSILMKDDKKDSLTLSVVLNVLDGINERTGQRCFWTTNACPPEDHFDAAFLRPGRMDMMIDFTRCTREGIEYLMKAYYDQQEYDRELLKKIDDYVWSPAEVKQKCKESRTINEALFLLANTPSPYRTEG